MILLVRKMVTAFGAIAVLAIVAAAQSVSTDQNDVIGRAREAYYNLSKHGFNGFKASIEPNWEVTLGPTATPENLKVFRAFRFSMIVDAKGNVTVSHEIVNPEKLRVEPYINQIHGNVNRLVTSFFSTWSTFVVNSPFPEPGSQVKLQDSGKQYQVLYTTQSADATLTMESNLLISEWRLSNQRGKRVVSPRFQKTSHGLLLSGYQSTFEPSAEGLKTTLELQVDYQELSGLKLPNKLRIKGVYGGEPVEAELEFNQYVLNPR